MSTEFTNHDNPPEASRTRREFLRRGGAAAGLFAAAPLLAACGASTAPEASKATGLGIGELDFMSWEGYDIPNKGNPAIAAWRKSHNVLFKASYIASNEDVAAKIKGGGGHGIDIITYGQQNKDLWRQLGFLHDLDDDKLPNLKNLFPTFRGDFGNFWVEPDGTRTGVPYVWGVGAMNYDSSVIPKRPDTYDILFEPKYKGKVAVVDSVHDVLVQVAIAQGIDYSKMTSADFRKVKDWTARLLAQTKGMATSLGDVGTKMTNGECVLAFPGYGLINSYAAGAGKKTIKFVVPREGSFAYCDSWAVPKTTDNLDGALAWINETLTPHVSGEAANYTVSGTPVVPAAVPTLTREIRSFYPYQDLGVFLDKATFGRNPPVKSDRYVTLDQAAQAWRELKAAV